MKTIKICPTCKNPLIMTFIVPVKEWLCWECKGSFPMTLPDDVDETPELKEKLEADTKEFKEAMQGYVPPFSYNKRCNQCKLRRGYHETHMTKVQKDRHEKARKRLFIRRKDENST